MTTSSGPELRISDTEREAAVTALGEHYAAGRLTRAEYDERAGVAFAARTRSALRPLFVDLPSPHPFAAESGPSTGSTGWSRPRPDGPGSWVGAGWPSAARRRGLRPPLLPLLLVLLGLAVVVGAPWLVFVGLGVFWLTRSHRGGGCGSMRRAHGSR